MSYNGPPPIRVNQRNRGASPLPPPPPRRSAGPINTSIVSPTNSTTKQGDNNDCSAWWLVFALLFLSGCNLTIDENGIGLKPRQTVVTPVAPPHDPAQDVVFGNEFRMLVLYDSKALAKLPLVQLNMITGREVREFGDKHCVKGPDGKTSEMRFVDYRDDLVGVWSTMRDRSKPESYPWLCLENGPHHWEGPLPKEWPTLKSLLDKYAGIEE